MSNPINDGGPAFAAPGLPYYHDGVPQNPYDGHGWAHDPQPGMTLRDYFAGQALGHIPALIDHCEENLSCWNIAEHAYQVADAMIAARKTTKTNSPT
jgi:hypothetical protein